MEVEKPKISFCIPTYSRPQEVEGCVNNILKYCEYPIEIVITDNSTDSRTKEIVEAINDSRIRYYQNKENIGRSNNVLHALEMSTTDYAFLLSDEDRINLECISKIIQIIKEKHPGLILGKYQIKSDGSIFSYKNLGLHKKQKEAVIKLPFQGNLRPMVVKCSIVDYKDLFQYEEVMYMQQYISYDACTKGDLLILDECMGIIDTNEQLADLSLEETKKLFDYDDLNKKKNLYFSPEYRMFQFQEYILLLEKRMKIDIDVLKELFNFYFWQAVVEYQFSVCFEKEIFRDFGRLPRVNVENTINWAYEDAVKFVQSKFTETDPIIQCFEEIKNDLKDNLLIWNSGYLNFKREVSNGKNIILFGASQRGKHVLEILTKLGYKVTAFCDNSEFKWGKKFYGLPIISPKQITSEDVIWISSTYYKEIGKQLDEMGVSHFSVPSHHIIANLEVMQGNNC